MKNADLLQAHSVQVDHPGNTHMQADGIHQCSSKLRVSPTRWPLALRRGRIFLMFAVSFAVLVVWFQELVNQQNYARAVGVFRLSSEMRREHGPAYELAPQLHLDLMAQLQRLAASRGVISEVACTLPEGISLTIAENKAHQLLTASAVSKTANMAEVTSTLDEVAEILSAASKPIAERKRLKRVPFQNVSIEGLKACESALNAYTKSFGAFLSAPDFKNGLQTCVSSRLVSIILPPFLSDYAEASQTGLDEIEGFSKSLTDLEKLMRKVANELDLASDKYHANLMYNFADNVKFRKLEFDYEFKRALNGPRQFIVRK